jgi:hypothetical protein
MFQVQHFGAIDGREERRLQGAKIVVWADSFVLFDKGRLDGASRKTGSVIARLTRDRLRALHMQDMQGGLRRRELRRPALLRLYRNIRS